MGSRQGYSRNVIGAGALLDILGYIYGQNH